MYKLIIDLPNPLTEQQVNEKMDKADFVRAGRDCICSVCKRVYGRHPPAAGAEYMNELCDGTLVKL